jgi:pSer/pThr/pTyr-binding forkhead associated (FHA) protein
MSDTIPTNGHPPKAGTSAELRVGGRVYRLAAPSLSLGRHSEDRTYVPDLDLGDLPDGKTVSRKHARVFREDDDWFIEVEPETSNPTIVDGYSLAPGQKIPLTHGQVVQFGRVAAAFHHDDPVQYVSAELIDVRLEPSEIEVEPGSAASATITVVNFTDHVDQFMVEVRGLPTDWYAILLPQGIAVEKAEIGLFHTRARVAPASDAMGRFQILFKPPRHFSALAGVHRFTVRVTTKARPRLRHQIEGELTIAPFAGLEIVQLPTHAPSVKAEFAWSIRNTGNAIAPVTMWAEPAGVGGVGTFFSVPGFGANDNPEDERDAKLAFQWERVEMQVPAGGSAEARMGVAVKERHWLGGALNYRFTVFARSGEEEVQDDASIECPPRIPLRLQTLARWLLGRVALFAPIIAILAALWVFVLWPPEIEEFRPCLGPKPPDELLATAECAPVPSDGVSEGAKIHLRYAVQHATFVNIEGSNFEGKKIDLGDPFKITRGAVEEAPITDTRYVIIAQNAFRISTNVDQTIGVHSSPKVVEYKVSTHHLKTEAEMVVLEWKVEAAGEPEPPNVKITALPAGATGGRPLPPTAKDCNINEAGGERLVFCGPGSGQVTDVPPVRETRYRLVVENDHGKSTSEQIVVVDPPAIDALTAVAPAGPAGREVRLQWVARGITKPIRIREGKTEEDTTGPAQEVHPETVDAVVRPTADTWYTVTARNAGGEVSKKVKVSAVAVQPQVFFRAEPDQIVRGEAAALTWRADGASAVTIEPGIGAVPPGQGNVVVKPEKDTEYLLTATFNGRKIERTVAVTVKTGAVLVDFFTTATPSIEKGEKATLTYSVQNAEQVILRDGTGKVIKDQKAPDPRAGILGSVEVEPEKTMVFVLTARTESSQITQPVTIEVKPKPSPTPEAPAAAAAAGGAAPAAGGAAPAAGGAAAAAGGAAPAADGAAPAAGGAAPANGTPAATNGTAAPK